MREIKTLYVHAGKFHADDVMTTALVELAFGAVRTIRILDVLPEYYSEESIVADIGYGKYDHHQPDCEKRSDGTPFAACGLVFRDIWTYLFPAECFAKRFLTQYIRPIELDDNGIRQNPLSIAVNSFVPLKDSSPENMEVCFRKAVEYMKAIVRNEVERAFFQNEAFEKMMEDYESSDKNIVILDEYLPAIERLIPTSAKYLLFPSNRGGWNLQAVPKAFCEYGNKENLPAEWLSVKPEGCTFVHRKLFLAAFSTKELALKALESSDLFKQKMEARRLINGYCQREFGNDADFSNTSLIPIGYGRSSDGKFEASIFVDIDNYRLLKYEGDGTKQKLFASITELNEAFAKLSLKDLLCGLYSSERRAAK